MDFRKTVIDSFDKLAATGAIEKCIEEQLAKTISEIIASEMRSYSKFGDALKEKIREALVLHGDLELPSYNDALLKIIQAQVEKHTHDLMLKKVEKNIKELLQPAPAEITLTDLVSRFIEHVKANERYGCHCHGDHGEITLTVKDGYGGFRHVKLGLKDEDSLSSRRDRPLVEIGVTEEGEIFTLSFRDTSVEKEMFAGPFYGFERMLFQMKAAGSKLIFDADVEEIDRSYGLLDT